MKKALLIIDYINDFVEDEGKLTCGKPGQDIDQDVAKIVDSFRADGELIVVASDCHLQEDIFNPEHQLFPPHCISGTTGCELYGKTALAVAETPAQQRIDVDKLRYSAFAGTNLDLRLRERNIRDLYLVGVCTDICVLHTAVDAYNLGYRIHVYEKGVASFNPEGHRFALAHFKSALGATIL